MELYPILLKPCYRDYLWGGIRLRKEFGKSDGPNPTAESWELVCRPDAHSISMAAANCLNAEFLPPPRVVAE